MQFITRKQLFNLARTSILGESDKSDIDFAQEFNKEWHRVKQNIKRTSKSKDLISEIYNYMFTWLKKNNESIELVGEGSSRNAFILKNGKCLKVAKNITGIEQNKQEFENYDVSKTSNLQCFTQIYHCDLINYSSLLIECCTRTTYYDDFYDLYTVNVPGGSDNLCLDYIIYYIEKVFYDRRYKVDVKKYKNINALLKYLIKDRQENPPKETGEADIGQELEFWKQCLYNKKIQWDILRDLLKFYHIDANNINKLRIGDLYNPKNWGLTLRDNKIIAVILDYGLSREIGINRYNFPSFTDAAVMSNKNINS